MLHFKVWFMLVGVVITNWFVLLTSIIFFASAIIWKSRIEAKIIVGAILFLGYLILTIYLVKPFQWQILSNLGGI